MVLQAPIVLLLAAAGASTALQLPPNGELRVAYRQLQAGKLSEPFWHLTLRCWEGVCTLREIGFGAWMEMAGVGKVWLPGARTMTSGTAEFVLTTVGAGTLEAEERGDGTTIKYRWSFTTTEDVNARGEARRQDKVFSRLTGFSGAAVRRSPFAEKILAWELVPFTGWLVKPQPACEMALEGVPD
jgi:hypothetical protein